MSTEWLGMSGGSAAQSPLVLCVARDADLLNLIRRYCSTLPCRTYTTESAEEALVMVGSSRVNLVMADQRLGTMSGIQLLKEVALRSPATARVLLASYPENHNILQGEEERIHGIIGKPWDGPSFQRTLLAILEWQEERARLRADTATLPLSQLGATPKVGAERIRPRRLNQKSGAGRRQGNRTRPT